MEVLKRITQGCVAAKLFKAVALPTSSLRPFMYTQVASQKGSPQVTSGNPSYINATSHSRFVRLSPPQVFHHEVNGSLHPSVIQSSGQNGFRKRSSCLSLVSCTLASLLPSSLVCDERFSEGPPVLSSVHLVMEKHNTDSFIENFYRMFWFWYWPERTRDKQEPL